VVARAHRRNRSGSSKRHQTGGLCEKIPIICCHRFSLLVRCGDSSLGVTKFDELLGAKSKQVTLGGIPGSTVEQGPILLRDLLGANIKVVSGYKGTADIRLAIESGELDGFLNSWESTKITSLDKVKSGEWLILAQLGDNPITELPATNVPTIPQIAKTEE
jgi:hypothetical protein